MAALYIEDDEYEKDRRQKYRLSQANRISGDLLEEFFRKQVQSNRGSEEESIAFENTKIKKGEYPCIFLPHLGFTDLLENAIPWFRGKLLRDISFMDAGCGAGHKLLLAYTFGFGKVWGAEIEEKYIKLAKKIIPLFTSGSPFKRNDRYIKFLNKDIREIDYSEFDIVYFYTPMSEPKKQIEFEEQLAKTIKPGGLILAAGTRNLHGNKLVKRISDSTVYEKI